MAITPTSVAGVPSCLIVVFKVILMQVIMSVLSTRKNCPSYYVYQILANLFVLIM
ncbi:hypothetical protein BD560DRAFT_397945 [Blakeslea trispora]|nr:hypothetical protein BD560DRAFT_397945 [Blakeslea trispora]